MPLNGRILHFSHSIYDARKTHFVIQDYPQHLSKAAIMMWNKADRFPKVCAPCRIVHYRQQADYVLSTLDLPLIAAPVGSIDYRRDFQS